MRGKMTGSGIFFTDAALVSFMVYVFLGGWLVTLAGLALSIMVMSQPGRRVRGVVLAIGCFAPAAYIALWALLDRFAPGGPSTTDILTYAVMAGLAVCVFGAPLAAMACIVRAPKGENAPS